MSQADLGAIERTRGGKRGVVTRRATTWPATGWLKEEKSEKDSRCERNKKKRFVKRGKPGEERGAREIKTVVGEEEKE